MEAERARPSSCFPPGERPHSGHSELWGCPWTHHQLRTPRGPLAARCRGGGRSCGLTRLLPRLPPASHRHPRACSGRERRAALPAPGAKPGPDKRAPAAGLGSRRGNPSNRPVGPERGPGGTPGLGESCATRPHRSESQGGPSAARVGGHRGQRRLAPGPGAAAGLRAGGSLSPAGGSGSCRDKTATNRQDALGIEDSRGNLFTHPTGDKHAPNRQPGARWPPTPRVFQRRQRRTELRTGRGRSHGGGGGGGERFGRMLRGHGDRRGGTMGTGRGGHGQPRGG